MVRGNIARIVKVCYSITATNILFFNKNKNMKSATLSHVNPMVVFWLGVLTGALIVGFIFLYNVLNSSDYNNSLLKFSTTSPTYNSTLLKGSLSMPIPQI